MSGPSTSTDFPGSLFSIRFAFAVRHSETVLRIGWAHLTIYSKVTFAGPTAFLTPIRTGFPGGLNTIIIISSQMMTVNERSTSLINSN